MNHPDMLRVKPEVRASDQTEACRAQPYMLLFISATTALSAFEPPKDWAPRPPALASGKPWPAVATSQSTMLSLGDTGGKTTPYVFGTNLPVYWGRRYSRQPAVRAQLASVANIVRWPGGSPANQYIWGMEMDGTLHLATAD